MALLCYTVVVDSHDVAAQARWWSQTLDWRLGFENAEEAVICPHDATEEPVETLAEWIRQPQELADPEGNESCVLSSRDR